MGYRPPVPQSVHRAAAREGIRHPAATRAARRAIGDPLMSATERHRGAPRAARRHARPGVLAQPRGAGRDAGVQGVPAPRVPAERVGVARPRRPPRLPEADGRVARAGRRQRLHAPAGRRASCRTCGSPRSSCPASRCSTRRRCRLRGVGRRPARREPRGPADEDRRQPRSSVEPRRHRPLRAGGDPRPLRSRSLADDHAPRRDPPVRRVRRPRCSAVLAAQQATQGAGLRILTETVASPTLAAQIDELLDALPAGEVGAVGAGRPPQRARGQPARVRRVRRRAVRDREGRRHPVARRRLPLHRRRRA